MCTHAAACSDRALGRRTARRIPHQSHRHRCAAAKTELADRQRAAEYDAVRLSTAGCSQGIQPDSRREPAVGFGEDGLRRLGICRLCWSARGLADPVLLARARLGCERPRVTMECRRVLGDWTAAARRQCLRRNAGGWLVPGEARIFRPAQSLWPAAFPARTTRDSV